MKLLDMIDVLVLDDILTEISSGMIDIGNDDLMLVCFDMLFSNLAAESESFSSKIALALIDTGNYDLGRISDFSKETALMGACKNRMNDVVIALLASGKSNPHHINLYGKKAFNYASREMSIEFVNYGAASIDDLIEKYPNIVHAGIFKTQIVEVTNVEI